MWASSSACRGMPGTYCTALPNPQPGGYPRGAFHGRTFDCPVFRRNRGPDAALPDAAARNLRRKRPAKSAAADPQPTAEATECSPAVTTPPDSSGKPQIRIDARYNPSSVKVDRVPQNRVAEA